MEPKPSTSTGGSTYSLGFGERNLLEGIGVIYDQKELENDIIDDINERVRANERLDNNKQLQDVAEEVITTRRRIKIIDNHLNKVKDENSLSKAARKKIQMIRREKDNKTKQLRKLEAKLRSLKIFLGHEDIPNSEEVDDETRQQLQLLLGDDETDVCQKIRSRETTPFETVRKLKIPDVDMFDQYLDEKFGNGTERKNKRKCPSVDVNQQKRVLLTQASSVSKLVDLDCSLELLRPTKPRTPNDGRVGSMIEHLPSNRPRFSDKSFLDTQEVEYSTEDSEYTPSKEGRSSSGSECEDLELYKRSKKKKKGIVDDGDLQAYLSRLEKMNEISDYSDEDIDEEYRIPSSLWNRLYGYQQTCVKWLWELHQFKCGGIVGDEMGLGKTVQVISFLCGLRHSNVKTPGESYRGLGPVILVAPTTLMHQWVKEFHKWFPQQRIGVLHNSGSYTGKKKSALIEGIHNCKGTLITSYQGIVMYLDDLLRHHWHYIILDEGHKIRNPDAQATLAVKQFQTPHRIILSGSPIQNNLRELWSLFDFVFPGKLGTLPVFMAEFAVPITQGGYANASETQVAVGYRCATILRDAIKPYLLRRMKNDVKATIKLPPRNEQVIFCRLSERQRNLYKEYLDSHEVKKILDGRVQIFVGLINLRKICNHPDLYDGGPNKATATKLNKITSHTKTEDEVVESEATFGFYKRSGKLIVVDALLKLWYKQKQRVLIFTQSRQMLRILVEFVRCRQYTHLSMDGTTAISSRQPDIDKFNQDPSIFIFILTTRVGGLGINLTGANRVIIYDPDWNPSTDMQARERVWRIGQQRDVTIYRLLSAGTIEEKIYHRQIFKQFLTNRILKNPKQRRFFKTNELYELFTLSEDIDKNKRTETSDIFAGTGSTVDKKRLKNSERMKKRLEEENRRARMKRLARKLSQKIGSGEKIVSADFNEANTLRLHGITIEGAIRKSRYRNGEETRDNDVVATNDYILAKLFRNTNIHSVMKHDRIMESAVPDGSLMESEAQHVAQEAIKKLRAARRHCYRANEGIPNWTGRNGALRGGRKVLFGTKRLKKSPLISITRDQVVNNTGRKEKQDTAYFSRSSQELDSQNVLSSSALMSKIRARNVCGLQTEELLNDDEDEQTMANATLTSENETSGTDELIMELRTFIAIQSEVNGQATTREIVSHFKERVSKDGATLFKSLLRKLCEFHRENDDGIWRLRPEFR